MTMHKNKIYFCVTSVLFTLLLATSSTILTTETVSGQMMGNPNMMNKGKMAMGGSELYERRKYNRVNRLYVGYCKGNRLTDKNQFE